MYGLTHALGPQKFILGSLSNTQIAKGRGFLEKIFFTSLLKRGAPIAISPTSPQEQSERTRIERCANARAFQSFCRTGKKGTAELCLRDAGKQIVCTEILYKQKRAPLFRGARAVCAAEA
jgi:hypothetical protein